MIKYLFIFVLSLFVTGFVNAQGYEIKVKINNLSDAKLILGHHFTDKLYPDDTIILDKKGSGVFKGKKKLAQGMYFIIIPSTKYFSFFITDNQKFSLESDTVSLDEKLVFKNSPENTAIYEYLQFMSTKMKESKELQTLKKDAKDEKEKKQIGEKIDKIGTEFKEYIKKFIADYSNSFVGKFIKATQDIEIPDLPKDANGKVTDSLFQYKYYKKHFFDNIDLADERMLKTRDNLYEEKVKKYIDKVVPQFPDSLNKECDWLLSQTEKNKDVFKFMLITLFNHYASSQIMGFDAVYSHIAENWYIPKADWSDTAFIEKTKKTVKKLKPLLIGKQAPNLKMLWVPAEHFKLAKTDTATANNPHAGTFTELYNVNANYTILAFWESDCGHCKKLIPQLYDIYKNLKPKGVEVFAVHMLGGVEGKKKWIKFVNDHEMWNWMNVWNPYEYKYKELYDINSTPVLIVLDKNKKIIAKRLEPKQIEEFINKMIEFDKKKGNK